MAPIGVTNPAAGVIATSPATAPVIMPSIVGCALNRQSRMAHVSPAVAVAVWVTTKALVARAPAPSALPALNPNQPNHRMPAPNTAKGRLCGGAILSG
jgi:hypothetical protein